MSVRVPNGRATLEVADSLSWKGYTGTNWFAMLVQSLAQIPFDAVVNDPVITPVRIDPNSGLQLAQMFRIDTTVQSLVR